MKLNEAFPSRYLNAADAKPPRTVTMAGIRQEEVGQQKDLKWVLYLHNEPKGIVLGKTIWAQIAYVTGSDDTDGWMGKQIEIYQELVRNPQGQMVPGLRVRAPQQYAQTQPAPQVVPPHMQPGYAPAQQSPRPGAVMQGLVHDEVIPDPGEPMRASQRRGF